VTCIGDLGVLREPFRILLFTLGQMAM